MDDLDAFRQEVRQWLDTHCPVSMRGPGPEEMVMGGSQATFATADQKLWFERMRDKGWFAPGWPAQYGGGGLDAHRVRVLEDEMRRMKCRVPQVNIGIWMLGPVLLEFGNEAQKARFLPPMTRGEQGWCQGFSEPNAGSDLASLKTAAREDGDHYVVSGAKIWTSGADQADWMYALVRTDPAAPKHLGISLLLIDMKSPGVTVRPIKLLDGGYEVNDVFLENVKVPVDQRIYEENKGWTCAKFLLAHERAGIAGVARSKRNVERLKAIAKAEIGDDGKPLIQDDEFQRKLSELEIDLSALEMTELRTLAREQAGKGPGPESSLLKIKGTEIQQRLTELTLEAVGNYAQPYPRGLGGNEFAVGPDYASAAAPVYFNWRKASIYGGSNEIQRNIIAKMVLGL